MSAVPPPLSTSPVHGLARTTGTSVSAFHHLTLHLKGTAVGDRLASVGWVQYTICHK